MILNFTSLKKYRGKVAMVDGCFDPLHHGHMLYFDKASELNLPLLCNVASDHHVEKKRAPFMTASARAQILNALKSVTFVHINNSSTAAVLRELRPRFYIKGKEWEGKLPKEEIDICGEHDIAILFMDTKLDSSSRILDDYFYRRQVSD